MVQGFNDLRSFKGSRFGVQNQLTDLFYFNKISFINSVRKGIKVSFHHSSIPSFHHSIIPVSLSQKELKPSAIPDPRREALFNFFCNPKLCCLF